MKKLKKIRVRMYRHGLGDCFLLTLFYGRNQKYQILIDCGVIMGTDDPQKIMTEVAKDIKTEVGKQIDTVIITHEHWDHLSGFKQARTIFDDIDFGEVWMAWTEDPDNDLANTLRKTREARKKALQMAIDKSKTEAAANPFLTPKQLHSRQQYLAAVDEIFSFSGGLGVGGNSVTNEALQYVKGKSKSAPFYCYPGREPLSINGIEGLRVYVLGPPEDEKLIKKDLSEKEVYHKLFMNDFGNSFLGAMGVTDNGTFNDKYLPFGKFTGNKISEISSDPVLSNYNAADNEWRKIDNDWLDFSGQLALALDSDTNNTSLVLAFELTGTNKFLLFPGDAQVGNWLSWHNYKWKVKNNGTAEEIDIKKIFENTVLYKVGHHGSHNATLKEKGLELMSDKDMVAMIPVNKAMAVKKKWNMPFPSLLNRLKEKTAGRVLVADEDFDAAAKPSNISLSDWSRFCNAVIDDKSNKLYCDYEIIVS